MKELLAVDDLGVEYHVGRETIRALDGTDLTLQAGEILGIVGESGSGKSTLGLAIGNLLPPSAHRVRGQLTISGLSVFDLSPDELRTLRRQTLGFVFQNPISSLDPTLTVARQLDLVGRPRSATESEALLAQTGLNDPKRVMASYPHQLSGGMAQRVAIAIALASTPRLVVADEPTASLDASIRLQILRLLVSLCGDMSASVVLLSHDLHAILDFCGRVVVMYGGRAVESGLTKAIFRAPSHPYTLALLQAIPGSEGPGGRLHPIDGSHPVLNSRSGFCSFAPRCTWATDMCRSVRPEPRVLPDGRTAICHRAEEVLEAGSALNGYGA